MRCLTLADALSRRGAQVRFLSRDLSGYLRDMLDKGGYQYRALCRSTVEAGVDDLPHASWLGTSQDEDARACISALEDDAWDWLVVDHYALDFRWESRLRAIARNIVVIDDIADRRHDCELLLDQNFYPDMESRYDGKVPVECRRMLGPCYALVRSEFRQLRNTSGPRKGGVRKVLVFLGGMDAENFTMRAIEALAIPNFSGLEVDVVVGIQHPQREAIEAACYRYHFSCHVQTNRMAELMAGADLAIGAAGSATWERCCVGLPVLAVSLAENQTDIAKAIEFAGVGVYLGAHRNVSAEIIRGSVEALLSDVGRFEDLSSKAYAITDGQGTDRVCLNMGS